MYLYMYVKLRISSILKELQTQIFQLEEGVKQNMKVFV
jgi:hypothetical protein